MAGLFIRLLVSFILLQQIGFWERERSYAPKLKILGKKMWCTLSIVARVLRLIPPRCRGCSGFSKIFSELSQDEEEELNICLLRITPRKSMTSTAFVRAARPTPTMPLVL